MRIIIVIQSIIIIVGAYYVYTLSKGIETPEDTDTDSEISIEVVETITPPSEEDVTTSETLASSSAELPVLGGNDAGMEYPTIDGEVFPQ